MRWVVFLRGVNVGKANRCQPAVIASQLSRLGVINIGAVGTFVVREDVSESALCAAIAKQLPFKCEIMICPARDIIKLAVKGSLHRSTFRRKDNAIRECLTKRSHPASASSQPPCLPSPDDWLLKIIAIEDQFVLGVYRREMKAIGYLGKIEKLLRCARNDSQLEYDSEKVVQILS